MNTKYLRDQQGHYRQYHSRMELYRHGDIQQAEAFNLVRSFRKRTGKVGWFFENVEQGLRTIDAVAFGLCRLLHNSDALQPLDSSLSGREGNAQLTSYTRGSNEWIGSQQINNPQRCVGGLASYLSLPLGKNHVMGTLRTQ
jgi:hypothetical protein